MDDRDSKALWILGGMIFMFLGALYIIYGYYTPKLNWMIFVATVLSYAVTMLAERKLVLPGRVSRIYRAWWFERASFLLYLPCIIMLFMTGYAYGAGMQFASILVDVVYSILLGMVASSVLYFLNEFLRRRVRRGERPHGG